MTARDEKPFEPGIGFFASLFVFEFALLFVGVIVFTITEFNAPSRGFTRG